jgi:methylene-tetrahydromethanopterin dehydrogenase
MEKPFLLHLFTPEAQASPFDVNMAYDAGYTHVIPYANVTLAQVAGLTQDAIFSRGPKGAKRTGILIGGRDIALAADMLDAACKAMVPPFEVSVMADPSGAFTTAAAQVACVVRALKTVHQTTLAGKNVLVLGGTGPVGSAAAVIAAAEGARVWLASHSTLVKAEAAAEMCSKRYGANVTPLLVNPGAPMAGMIAGIDVVLAAAKAGTQVMSQSDLAAAAQLLVVADVNAVPPAGVEGIGVMDDAKPIAAGSGKAVGIGALTVGNVKYQNEQGLFREMLAAEKPLYIDFRQAFALAQQQLER